MPMRIRVLLFATYREIVGEGEVSWVLPESATLRDFLDIFLRKHPRLSPHRASMLLAVNEAFADPATALHEGDEVALLPPVSGGTP